MERLNAAIRSAQRSRFARCAICYSPRNGTRLLAQDHCHETGNLRGFLCMHCNTGLGHFKDDPRLLRRAALYLIRFKTLARMDAAEAADAWMGYSRRLPEQPSAASIAAKQLAAAVNAKCRAAQAAALKRGALCLRRKPAAGLTPKAGLPVFEGAPLQPPVCRPNSNVQKTSNHV
jgi:Recombination endonuclease VII